MPPHHLPTGLHYINGYRCDMDLYLLHLWSFTDPVLLLYGNTVGISATNALNLYSRSLRLAISSLCRASAWNRKTSFHCRWANTSSAGKKTWFHEWARTWEYVSLSKASLENTNQPVHFWLRVFSVHVKKLSVLWQCCSGQNISDLTVLRYRLIQVVNKLTYLKIFFFFFM